MFIVSVSLDNNNNSTISHSSKFVNNRLLPLQEYKYIVRVDCCNIVYTCRRFNMVRNSKVDKRYTGFPLMRNEVIFCFLMIIFYIIMKYIYLCCIFISTKNMFACEPVCTFKPNQWWKAMILKVWGFPLN